MPPRPADTPEQWPVDKSITQYSGYVVDVRTDHVRSPKDGSQFDRDVVAHPGAVAVVALDDDDNVLVVSQYRHAVGRRLIELPAGLKDVPGEPAHECAERELYEEGHVRAKDWRFLVRTFATPGMTDEAIDIFVARGISHVPDGERHNGEHEEADMSVMWVPLDDLVSAILDDDIHNAITSVGLFSAWAARRRPGGLDVLPTPARLNDSRKA